ncbi:hypothetical protein FVEG_17742 [Fusarium verticillioides 7600]|uniref:Bul1 C-terminal domain-containing protein n=1 Tax=Gibberella moniliformis (strain M3125 / FGSC 7600) TaxID=334819 RepID=A0A139YBU4_GIBM7|nr:hypothetical protein FVEG_17742 [Fusarium verticillioides 7600]KYG13811.1 hypothetical protein FVEG_17742 [Fusarium verticillioides 7600]
MPSRCLLSSRAKQDPTLEIDIHDHYESKVYTFGSTISGFVTITAHNQLPFQSLQIDLRGITSTCGHAFQYGTPFKTHVFMQLQMPTSASALPVNQSFEPGKLYHIPFRFAIPEQLSSTACNHQNRAVRERHLQPQPTMGSWDRDDLAGGSANIDYVIRARLVLSNNKQGREQYLDQSRSVKVIPALPEQPPLHISPDNSDYCLSQSKTIRKGVIGTKMGVVRASATQPEPVLLCLDGLNASGSQIPIDLEYIPVSTSTVIPEIRVKSATIETSTNFWLGVNGYLPDRHEKPSNSVAPAAPWETSNALVLREKEMVDWKKDYQLVSDKEPERRSSESVHILKDCEEPHSASRSTSCASHWNFDSSKPRAYKTSLSQLFELPTDKYLFLPTFYSCLISRTYRIRVTLAIGAYGTTISLVVPLQVVANGLGNTQYRDQLNSFEHEVLR